MNKNEQFKAEMMLLLSMCLFGTIGVFRRYLPVPSGFLASVRGLVGTLFLLIVLTVEKKPFRFRNVKGSLGLLILSGAMIGFNWILLFEAYNYTSVATATLCYYMAPVFILLLSPLVLKEKLTRRKLIALVGAVVGMVLVSGVYKAGFSGSREIKGILLGLGAAALYATVVLINKFIKPEIAAMDRTVVQLFFAGVSIIPYVLLTEDMSSVSYTPMVLFLLLFVGIFHTGVAYSLWFGGVGGTKAQTAAVLSYLDPAIAVILSAVLLKEPMGIYEWIGAFLMLLCMVYSELEEKRQ